MSREKSIEGLFQFRKVHARDSFIYSLFAESFSLVHSFEWNPFT